MGQHFGTIKDMNGSIFSKASNMNGVGFEVLARIPVPHLPPIYHTFPLPLRLPPPPPPRFFVCRFKKKSKLYTLQNPLGLCRGGPRGVAVWGVYPHYIVLSFHLFLTLSSFQLSPSSLPVCLSLSINPGHVRVPS